MSQCGGGGSSTTTSGGGGSGGSLSEDFKHELRKIKNKNVPTRTSDAHLGASVSLERPQCAVSKFDVKHGDIAAVAHSSTGQPVALLLLQCRHLCYREPLTVPTTRTDARSVNREVPSLSNECPVTARC